MCISPRLVRNPNRTGIDGKLKARKGIDLLKDTTSAFIRIPCGVCCECVAARQLAIVQRIQTESIYNHIFFSTLTYSNKMLPRYVCKDTGWIIPYADIKDFQDMVKRIRKDDLFGRPFRYLVVSERGSRKGRPHFHVLWLLPKYDKDTPFDIVNLEIKLFRVIKDQWKRNVAKRVARKDSKSGKFKKGDLLPDNVHPCYEPLFNYVRKYIHGRVKTNYDTHYVRPYGVDDCSDVAFYVSKYVLKVSDKVNRLQQALRLNYSDEDYDRIWKIVKPVCVWSKGVGLNAYKGRTGTKLIPDEKVISFLHNSVISSLGSYDSPHYMATNGSSYPLARYYLRRGDVYPVDIALRFYDKHPSDTGMIYDEVPDSAKIARQEHFNRRASLIRSHDQESLFDSLFNQDN